MRIITEKLYKFEELPEDVRKKVIERNRFVNVEWNDCWYTCLYEDFMTSVKEKYGVQLEEKDISFTGFSSQGDGASFIHKFSDKELARLLDMLKIAFRHGLKDVFIDHCEAEIKRTDNMYSHEDTVSAYVLAYFTGYDRIDSYFEEKENELERAIEEWKNTLCKELYRNLEQEYEYQTSDEAVAETLEAMEDEYYSDGTIYTDRTIYIVQTA